MKFEPIVEYEERTRIVYNPGKLLTAGLLVTLGVFVGGVGVITFGDGGAILVFLGFYISLAGIAVLDKAKRKVYLGSMHYTFDEDGNRVFIDGED